MIIPQIKMTKRYKFIYNLRLNKYRHRISLFSKVEFRFHSTLLTSQTTKVSSKRHICCKVDRPQTTEIQTCSLSTVVIFGRWTNGCFAGSGRSIFFVFVARCELLVCHGSAWFRASVLFFMFDRQSNSIAYSFRIRHVISVQLQHLHCQFVGVSHCDLTIAVEEPEISINAYVEHARECKCIVGWRYVARLCLDQINIFPLDGTTSQSDSSCCGLVSLRASLGYPDSVRWQHF